MILYYDKTNKWEIINPSIIALMNDMKNSYANKKYITMNECSKILYSLSQSLIAWNENDYRVFIGTLNDDTMMYYSTITSGNQGKKIIVNRDNINNVKNDLDFLLKLFSTILPSMILDRKKKLFVE